MGGDPNRGATLAVSFLNSAQQEIVGQGISGFLSATDNRFPALYEEPFPLNGVRDPNALPATFKVWAIDGVGYGTPPSQPQYNFTIIRSPRPGYNIGGYDFATAPLVPSFPASYMGSLRTLDPPAPKPSDRGQYLKVHLQCGQSISVSGFAHENTLYGANFAVDLYGANQQLVIPKPWVGITVSSYGTTTYQSSTFVNPNSAASDFYIRVYCDYENVQDFTINIASNEVDNPRPVAPDATGSGGSVSSEEYHFTPSQVDMEEILTVQQTELWAKVYWPAGLSAGPYPLVILLHGNHATCGHGSNPRIDRDPSDPNPEYFRQYTDTGTCPKVGDPGYMRPYDFVVVPSHTGFDYLATQLASRGYIVASVNANRGITSGDISHLDDPKHIFSRGRLVLKHLETLSKWNSGPTAFITNKTLGTSRKNANGWFGMQITVGAQPITVSTLGRIFITGNNQTHTVKIVRASDGTDMPNGSVAIPMTGGTNGVFKYVNLPTPITLGANTSYYVVSQETKNKDSWYDSDTTVATTSLATVNGRVTSSNGTSWSTAGAVPGYVYVPVDLKARVAQVLSVDLTGKIDFTNVGLMGHSRGGQGVLAAYNLYRNPGIDPRATPSPDVNWPSRIPGMNIKGIFEIAPTDYPLPTASNGSGAQYLNGDGSAWNVLLPMCDGDVRNLEGVRVFDRMMAYTGGYSPVPADSPATQKSSYTVWGTNHNFFNAEWQQSDPLALCTGNGNVPLFSNPATDGSGSPNQRTISSASLLALIRANVGASASPTFNQNFNPRYDLPGVITSITPPVRIDRGFTPSPNSSITNVVCDFTASLPPDSFEYTGPVVTFTNAATIPEHDYASNPFPVATPSPIAQALTVGRIGWSSASCSNYFQAKWGDPIAGNNISAYQTLDFRVSRQNNSANPSGPTNFKVQLISIDGTPTGGAVSLNKYVPLTGPVGIQDVLAIGDGLHSILQTVRIPLTDFTNAILSQVHAVRFIFSDTPTGAIYLANIRLSNLP
jgi:hypothetical protein